VVGGVEHKGEGWRMMERDTSPGTEMPSDRVSELASPLVAMGLGMGRGTSDTAANWDKNTSSQDSVPEGEGVEFPLGDATAAPLLGQVGPTTFMVRGWHFLENSASQAFALASWLFFLSSYKSRLEEEHIKVNKLN